MVDPVRTPTFHGFDVAFTSQVDQQVQYREACFNHKEAFVAAGWTVIDSVNGTGSAPAGTDTWNTTSDIVFAAGGSNHSWCQLRSPSGFLTDSETMDIVLDCNNASPDTTPQQMELYCATTPVFSGGTATARPTSAEETTVLTNGRNIIPWTAVTSGRWTSYYTSRGDVWFGVKPEGILEWRHVNHLFSNDNSNGGGEGNKRFVLFGRSDASFDVFFSSTLVSAANYRGLSPAGTDQDSANGACTAWDVTTWSGGISAGGQTISAPIDIFFDQSTRGRPLGTWPDMYGVPTSLTAGTLDDSETGQTFRRVCFEDVFLFFPTASLPFA